MQDSKWPELTVDPIGGWGWTAALAVALLLTPLFVQAVRGRITRGQAVSLAALRVVAVLAVLFAMLRPTLVYTDLKKLGATLVLMVDVSRSMQFADMAGGQTRWAALQETLKKSYPELTGISKELEVKVYAFDETTRVVESKDGVLQLPAEPTGQQSPIGAALNDMLRDLRDQRLAGVLLFSDGAQQALAERNDPPEGPVAAMAAEGVKLYTVAFGAAAAGNQVRDAAVRDLLVNPTVFVKNVLTVTGNVHLRGFANRPVEVELVYEKTPGKLETVARKIVQTSDGEGRVPVEMTYVPEIPGEVKVGLRVKPQDGEPVVANNELFTFVKVLKGGVKVLYLEGEVRVEQKYLRWSLGASPNLHVDFFQIDARSASPLPPGAAEWFDPGKYDVFIFGDLDSAVFKYDQLQKLAAAVRERGAGFMMLGGLHSFGPGGWQVLGIPPAGARNAAAAANEKAYLNLLPVAMERTERQGFDEAFIADLHLPGPLTWLPEPAGRFASILSLDALDNTAKWKSFPPLEGANRFRGYAPTADVVAQTADGKPILIAQEAGAGRVLAFAGDSTWKWWTRGYASEHRRLWRQLVLWLAHQDETADELVWLKLPQRLFRRGDRVDVLSGARDAEGKPLPDADVEAVVRLPDDTTRPLLLSKQGQERAGSFLDTQQSGDYVIEATGRNAGQTLGVAKIRFHVERQDLEMDNPAARPDLLARLAAMTQGSLVPPERLPTLVRQMAEKGLVAEFPIQVRTELWDQWSVFLWFGLALCLEWYLRKRWSLV